MRETKVAEKERCCVLCLCLGNRDKQQEKTTSKLKGETEENFNTE